MAAQLRGLEQVRAVLVVIGPGWLDTSVDGQRRLDRADDFVRREVEQALASGKPVVPVLVGGATMPAANALPVALRALANRSFAPGDPTAAPDTALLAAIPSPRLVFVNGAFDAGLSQLGELPDGVELRPLSQALAGDDPRAVSVLARRYERADEPFARFNAALATEGVLLRVQAGASVATPLHLVFVGAPAGGSARSCLRARPPDTRFAIIRTHHDDAHPCTLARTDRRPACGPQPGCAVLHQPGNVRPGHGGDFRTALDLRRGRARHSHIR